MERLGLAHISGRQGDATISLTPRGRFLGGGVTAEIVA
jgi:hypothetical protein